MHENVKVVYNASADTGVVAGSDNLTSYLLGKWTLFTKVNMLHLPGE